MEIRVTTTELKPFGKCVLVKTYPGAKGALLQRDDLSLTISLRHLEEKTAPVPDPHTIIELLRKVCEFSVMWNSGSNTFHLTGMRFGSATRIAVPVFKDGKVERQKVVTTTRHLSLKAGSFNALMYKLYAHAINYPLYAYAPGGKVERLVFENGEFSSEFVSASVLKD